MFSLSRLLRSSEHHNSIHTSDSSSTLTSASQRQLPGYSGDKIEPVTTKAASFMSNLFRSEKSANFSKSKLSLFSRKANATESSLVGTTLHSDLVSRLSSISTVNTSKKSLGSVPPPPSLNPDEIEANYLANRLKKETASQEAASRSKLLHPSNKPHEFEDHYLLNLRMDPEEIDGDHPAFEGNLTIPGPPVKQETYPMREDSITDWLHY
jgi:hypothetical protein